MGKKAYLPLAATFMAFLFLSWTLMTNSGKLLAEKEPPLKITGIVNATPRSVGGQIAIKLNDLPVTGAVVHLGNDRFSEREPGLYFGDCSRPVTIGTAIVLKIRRRESPRTMAGADEYIGRGTITNTLKPIYPKQNDTIVLHTTPQLIFRWAFAGATEKSCLLLDGGSYHYSHCQTELQHAVATKHMPRRAGIRWQMEYFFADLVFNRPLAPGSGVGLSMVNTVDFTIR